MEVFDKFYSVDEKDVDNSVKTLHHYRINYYYDFNNQELKLCIDRYLVIRESQHSYFIRDSKLKKTKRISSSSINQVLEKVSKLWKTLLRTLLIQN